MPENAVYMWLGRRLRLAVIGGGPGSFIGAMHRQAARLDDQYELVAAALSSDSERSRTAGSSLGIAQDRCYPDGQTLIKAEALRADGADVVAIMTPNDSHFQFAMQALSAGFDVICDKPMTSTLDEGLILHQKVKDTGRVFWVLSR